MEAAPARPPTPAAPANAPAPPADATPAAAPALAPSFIPAAVPPPLKLSVKHPSRLGQGDLAVEVAASATVATIDEKMCI